MPASIRKNRAGVNTTGFLLVRTGEMGYKNLVMANSTKTSWREILVDAQRRAAADRRFVQEAFTTDHRRPVLIKVNELRPDTFYWFDPMIANALFDAVLECSARDTGSRLWLGYTAAGQLEGDARRLQHAAGHLEQIRIFIAGRPGKEIRQGARLECHNTTGTPLAPYRFALAEGRRPRLFIVREDRRSIGAVRRSLGFFTSDPDVMNEITDNIEALVRGMGRRLETFERLQQLHQTTQQIARELESYSRRMELAIERARRRPDLLTPARFERIVAQSVATLDQLKEIPRRALRSMGKSRR
jgi:hypothetical protein